MQKQQTTTPGLTPGATLKPKEDYAHLMSLPTLFTIDEGNPFTNLQVIGTDEKNGPKYVKKIIILTQDNQQFAYSERTLMQIINSDYVLKLLHWQDTNQKPKRLALYMEYCQKGDLRTFLIKQNPSIARRIEIFIDVLYAMRFLHEKFIIHRDMKLENIFVTEEEKIKIADLGYAAQTVSVSFTEVGTFAYQAPQVYIKQASGYSQKVDVWSVGYLGFQILNKPLPEEVKNGKFIRDPFMPTDVLREKVKNMKGNLAVEYMKIFQQNPLVFVPNIPNSLKFLLGDMLVPYPQKRINFREIYEGKYLTNLRKQLQQNKEFGLQRVQKFKNLHILINQYPKIYQSQKSKQKRMKKHEQLYDYLYYRLYHPLTQKLYQDQSAKSIPQQKANSMKILLFLAMRKLKTIYQQVKGEDFFMLKKKLQESDTTVSKMYIQVKNSVEAYLRSQGQKGVEENKELLDEDYFIKLMKLHAKDVKINASSIIE